MINDLNRSSIIEKVSSSSSSLCFCRLLESGVGLVDLVISGLLGLRQLEPFEVVERSSGSASDDALVESIFLPLLVDLGRRPSLTHRPRPRAVGDPHFVFEQAKMLESHRFSGNAWSVDQRALLVDDVDDSDESVLERSDADVGNATDFHEVVEDADSHFEDFKVLSKCF